MEMAEMQVFVSAFGTTADTFGKRGIKFLGKQRLWAAYRYL